MQGNLPYPIRALRTNEFLYIRNFAPERMPMGDSLSALTREAIESGRIEVDTQVGFADMDASPTKAWLVAHRENPKWAWHFERAFGQRPPEELYDVRKDPDQVRNLAEDPAYAAIKRNLAEQLMTRLRDAKDPRVIGDGRAFDLPPYAGGSAGAEAGRKTRKK